MITMEKRNIGTPDETRKFQAHGYVEVVTIGDFTIGRGTYEPGWRWSQDLKPLVGTESCMVRHAGICLSGRMSIRTDDGTEATVEPGDVFVLEPGHDAWVIGDEPCILLDTGAGPYAKPSS